MDCERAKQLIDERVQAAAEGTEDAGDWTALDEHLSQCPVCAVELRELMQTRGLLASVSGNSPDEEEVSKMWLAIAGAGSAGVANSQAGSRRRRWLPTALTCTAVAAVLAIAFMIGWERYGVGLSRSRAERAVFALQGVGTTSAEDALLGSPPPPMPSLPAPGEIDAKRFLGPSSSDVGRLEALGYAVAGDNEVDRDSESYGYEVPFGPDKKRDEMEGETGTAGEPLLWVGSLDTGTAAEQGSMGGPDDWLADGTDEDSSPPPARAPRRRAQRPAQNVQENPPAEPEPPAPHVKIIRTGELAVETPSYADAERAVDAAVTDHGGFVADASVQEREGGALSGRLVIRVPPERFDALFAALKSIGRVEAEKVKAADVTAEYVDLEARIRSLQITEKRLQELIASKSFIDKIASLLEVEREMTRVRAEIEKHQGQLRVLADRVSLSTITLTLQEPERAVPSASLAVEVPVVVDAGRQLQEAVESLGGRMLSGETERQSNGTIRGRYRIEVSLARFADLLASIEHLGRVQGRQVSDRAFADADQPWARQVRAPLSLTLFEKAVQPPRGSMQIEVESLDTAQQRLNEMLADFDADIMTSEIKRREDGSSAAEIRVRVSAGRFGDLVGALPELGRTLAKSTAGTTAEIVGGAAQLPCDLNLTLSEPMRQVPSGGMSVEVKDFEPARDRLSELVRKHGVQVLASSSSQRTDGTWAGRFRLGIRADRIDGLVAQLEQLGRVSSREIRGTGLGDLSQARPDALGVIELALAEKPAISPEPGRAGQGIRRQLRDGLAGFYGSLGLIAYGLMVIAPWLLIVGVLGWFVTRIVRRRGRAGIDASQPAA